MQFKLMLKVKFYQNLKISRALFTAQNNYIINKAKNTKRKIDPLSRFWPPIFSEKLDINSRLITIEGCFGVNKSAIGKKIADHFALKYVDDVAEEYPYSIEIEGKLVNFMNYNPILPNFAKIYTSKMFWNDSDPIKNGKPLMMQILYYKNRYFSVCKEMARLLFNGEGIVMKRSPFADHVLALTYKELGLMSPEAFKYYNKIRLDSIVSLWRPHFIVYVKANPEIIRRNMTKRNDPMLNCPNFTDKFIETYQRLFETAYLEKQIGISKIITIDLSKIDFDDEEDFTCLMENMANENVDYDNVTDFSSLFSDWLEGVRYSRLKNSQLNFFLAFSCYKNAFPFTRIPKAISEGSFSDEALDVLESIVYTDYRFWNGKLDPLLFTSLKRHFFATGSINYNSHVNQPISQFLKFLM